MLSGCGLFKGKRGVFDSLADDYLDAASGEQLTVPEDLSSESITNALPIPEIEEHPLAKVFPKRPPRPVALVELEEEQAVRIQKLGDRQWMVVADAPELVWPVVIQFFTDNNVAVVEEDADSGILIGEWISIADTGYPGVIRATIHRGHQLAGDFSGQDRVRVRLEQGIRFGSTEIHLRYDNDKTRVNTAPQQSDDPADPSAPETLPPAAQELAADGIGFGDSGEAEPDSDFGLLPSTTGEAESSPSEDIPDSPETSPPAEDIAHGDDDSYIAETDPILLAEVGNHVPDAPGAILPPAPEPAVPGDTAFMQAPGITEANMDFETPSAALEVEAALLNALGRYYSAGVAGASASLVGRSVATEPKAFLERNDEGYPVLHLNVDFDRAWATVKGSLERSTAFEITDSNREQAEFQVTVDASAKENNFLRNVMPEGNKKTAAIRIHIQVEESGHVVSVLNVDGNPADAEFGDRILATLREYAI